LILSLLVIELQALKPKASDISQTVCKGEAINFT